MAEPVPIISVVGRTNSGKTTLIEKLIPELKKRGYRVGTIKHDVHNFEMDHPGKDTWRHTQAGADSVIISSSSKLALIKKVENETTLDELAHSYFSDVDIIITEGYKRDNKPKIEVFRSEVHKEPLCNEEDNLIALVTDSENGKSSSLPAGGGGEGGEINVGVPCFTLTDINQIADLLEHRFLIRENGKEGGGNVESRL